MESKLLTVQTTYRSFSNLGSDFQSTFSNNFLPILDNISQLFLPFQSFEFIQILFCLFQFFASSLWMANGKYWVHTRFADIIHYIAFFSSINTNITESIILFSVFFTIVVIISLLFVILYINFKKTRRFNKPLLYTIRLYFTFIGGAILHPLASLTGHLFNESVDQHKTSDILMLFFISIAFILSEVLFFMNQYFVNQSIYFHKSMFSTFDSSPLFFFFIFSPFFLFLSHLFNYYPTWSLFILIFFHVILIVIIFSKYIWMPFTLEVGNYFSLAVLCSIIFDDIFRIFAEVFHEKISQQLFFTICLIVLIIFFIISAFVIKYFRKKINSILSYSSLGESNLTNEIKFQYFNDLGLDQNMKKSIIYLIVGFTSGSDMFADFSLIQFCMDRYKDHLEMIILLMHLLPYFKSEKNLFENVLKQFHLIRHNSLYGIFIYYQAHRIKIFRQVTSTNLESTQLDQLKFMTNQLEHQIKTFWTLETANKNILSQIESQQRHLNNLWDESIEFNWSSVAYREEHIKFLIECCTDYQKAVQMTNIKDKIDTLSKERNDLCLLSLFLCFPHYMNRRIIDKDGNLIQGKFGGNSTSSSISSRNDKNSSISSELDFTNDEQVANSILTYGRLRLSMQNALNYANPGMHKILIFYTIISIFASLITFVSLFAVRLNSFDSLNEWNEKINVLIELRFAYVRSFFCLTVFFGKTTNKFNIKPIDCNWTNEQNRLFIELKSPFDELVFRYVNEAREQFSNLVNAVLELALENFNMTTLTSLLFDPIIQSNICYNGDIIKQANWSMEQMINFDIISYEILANEDENEISNWFINNSYWCHDVTNFESVENQFTIIENNLAYDLSNSTSKLSKNLILQLIIIAPCHFFLFIIPLPIILFLYSKEINHLIKIMLSTDQEYKEKAQKNVSLIIANENNPNTTVLKSSFNWKFLFNFLFIFIFFFAFIVFESLILYFAMQLNNKVHDYQIWSCEYTLLRSFIVEIQIEFINSVYSINFNTTYLSTAQNKAKIYRVLRLFEHFYYNIMNDSPGSPSSLEKDSFIDEIVLKSACEQNDTFDINFHDTYKCASLNLLFSIFRSLIEKCIEELEFSDGIVQGEVLDNLYHIIYAHLITDLIEIGDRFISLQEEEINRYKKNLFIIFGCGIIFLLFYLLFMILIIIGYKRIFKMAICLIRRLSPVGLINNSELTNYLLFKKGEEVETGVTHTIFNNSFDGIICLSVDGLVEIINKSFVNDYGYSPEQLVGQSIGLIFDDDSRIKIENQLKLMKNHESNNYNEHLICITNDGRAIPSYITLFGIKGNENNLILVIRDETILLQKKKRLEQAKKQSQDLLEQIMPQKVLMMLKQGKSEISFVVPSASVMFVDIVGFSVFSADLSPQQIMGTLSSLFGAFDVWIQKYPLMIKIKLIGDTYMAACGLFATDEDPKKHAIQCVDFAIHVLSILDDINLKLNLNLKVRIGINSDGPIIAGVLGTENRVFDIIGDTINVASRLEHKADPGHILMSEKTYDLVKDNNYRIIPKGEVFLKGKGDMKAYSI